MLESRTLPVIGLVGGVGSGKSSLASWVAQRRNVIIANGDEIGHRVLEHQSVKRCIRREFGDSVFHKNGDVNRAALGRRVFGATAEARQARSKLERIVHPQIREELEGTIRRARASQAVEAVILDAAVLLEAGWDDLCDVLIFVDAPYQQRLGRVAAGRGWNERQLALRETSQFSLEKKQAASDVTIENSAAVDEAGAALEQILERVSAVRR